MLKALEPKIRGLGYNLYEVAVMTDSGLEYLRLQPSNLCQNSYSVAKTFTMTAVGLLWDSGRLDPSEKVADILRRFLPEGVDPRWEDVTVDHALRHRIGFDRGLLDIDAEDASLYPTRDYLSIILNQPLPHAPGSHFQYTDAAFYLLSRIVAERAGTTCDRLLERTLFEALNFREAAWSRCPQGYPIGATGLYIAARDMVKLGWVYAHRGMYFGRRILSEAWCELALQRQYELHPCGEDLVGKGGMNGQMLLFRPDGRFAAAWHGYEPSGMPELMELLRNAYCG